MPRKKSFVGTHFGEVKLCNTPHKFSFSQMRDITEITHSMTDRHSKVLVARVDIRYPQDYVADGSNKDFSSTMQAVCREFSRKGYDPQYIAKREQKTSVNPHLHVAVLLDGNKKRSIASIHKTFEKHWANQLGIPLEEVQQKALVYPCNKAPDGSPRANGRMVKRSPYPCEQRLQINETIKHLSYIAKIDDDDVTPSSTKKFFTSQYAKDYNRCMLAREYWLEQNRKKKGYQGN